MSAILRPPARGMRDIGAAGATHLVRSPEQVALHLPVAGPTSRMLAYGIDLIVIWILEAGAFLMLFLNRPLLERLGRFLKDLVGDLVTADSQEASVLVVLSLFVVVQFAIECGYFVFWETLTSGRSPGKKVAGLRVVRDGGRPITLRASLVRNLLRMVDELPALYTVGLVSMVIARDGKRLGDLAADTIVIRLDRPEAAPALAEAGPEAPAGFRFDHVQMARVGENERALIRQTLRRIESLPADRREAILAEAVEALRERIGYPDVGPEEGRAFLWAALNAAQRR